MIRNNSAKLYLSDRHVTEIGIKLCCKSAFQLISKYIKSHSVTLYYSGLNIASCNFKSNHIIIEENLKNLKLVDFSFKAKKYRKNKCYQNCPHNIKRDK